MNSCSLPAAPCAARELAVAAAWLAQAAGHTLPTGQPPACPPDCPRAACADAKGEAEGFALIKDDEIKASAEAESKAGPGGVSKASVM